MIQLIETKENYVKIKINTNLNFENNYYIYNNVLTPGNKDQKIKMKMPSFMVKISKILELNIKDNLNKTDFYFILNGDFKAVEKRKIAYIRALLIKEIEKFFSNLDIPQDQENQVQIIIAEIRKGIISQ